MKNGIIARQKIIITLAMILFCCSSAFASLPAEKWNSGVIDGMVVATDNIDADRDGVNDVVCIKYLNSETLTGVYKIAFKIVRGQAFTDLYNWVTPPGDHTAYLGTIDIEQNGTLQTIISSVSKKEENKYEGKILIYDSKTGQEVTGSGSTAIEIISKIPPIYPLFSGFPYDVIGSKEYEWIINKNEFDPASDEQTGTVMVFKKNDANPGFTTPPFWQNTYSGGTVYGNMYTGMYDLDGDNKGNLAVHFNPDKEAATPKKGFIVFYKPSGSASFEVLKQFDASKEGNGLDLIYSQSSTKEMYPTRVDHGVTGGNLLFRENWEESDQEKNILYAYRADTPYSEIGRFTHDGETLSPYLGDFDGDGWDEVVLDYENISSTMSKVEVHKAQGGTFTLSKIWESDQNPVSGHYLIETIWDINKDRKADLGINWLPPSSDTTFFSKYTFYQMSGSSFSLLYQFTSGYPGGSAYMLPILTHKTVIGPTEQLTVPVDLDCTAGDDLAVANYYMNYDYSSIPPQVEQKGRVILYNLGTSQTPEAMPLTEEVEAYTIGGSVVNVQSINSNDLLLYWNTYEDMFTYPQVIQGTVSVLSCGTATSVNNPPGAPGSPSPANGSKNQSLNPTLQWTCSDEDGDSLTYDVMLDTVNPPVKTVSAGQTAATYTPAENLEKETTYYWKIIAQDSESATEGPVWSFTTGSEEGECTLKNISPDGAAAGSTFKIVRITAENGTFVRGKTQVDFGTDNITLWTAPIVINKNFLLCIIRIKSGAAKETYDVTVTTEGNVCSGKTFTIR